MDPSEAWKSLSRHHRVLEIETEALRDWVRKTLVRIDDLQKLFPSLKVVLPEVPSMTPPWNGRTYRDADGKFPSDIREHIDWLSEEDFKTGGGGDFKGVGDGTGPTD
jgi:hypothetical protein